MDDNTKDKLKVTALLKEYEEVRKEVRTFEILEIISIFLSILTFISLFIIAVLYSKYIFLFISPSISIFFIVVSMGMHAYTINLGIRSSQIAGKLKKILDEPTIEWENTVGVFGSIHENIFTKKIGKYWNQLSILTIVLGVMPLLIGLIYGVSNGLFNEVNFFLSLFFAAFYIVVSFFGLYLGYKLRTWEKIRIKDQVTKNKSN